MVVRTAVQPAAYAASIVFRHSLVGTVLLALALSSTGRAQDQQSYNYYSSYTSLPFIHFANGHLNSSATKGATVFMQMTGDVPASVEIVK